MKWNRDCTLYPGLVCVCLLSLFMFTIKSLWCLILSIRWCFSFQIHHLKRSVRFLLACRHQCHRWVLTCSVCLSLDYHSDPTHTHTDMCRYSLFFLWSHLLCMQSCIHAYMCIQNTPPPHTHTHTVGFNLHISVWMKCSSSYTLEVLGRCHGQQCLVSLPCCLRVCERVSLIQS